jgi:serine/threonine-protein kinase
MTTELSPAEWATLKRLWAAVTDAPPGRRDAVLADAVAAEAPPSAVVEALARMCRAGEGDAGALARLDRPAHVALGLGPPTGAEHTAEGPAATLVGRRLGPFRVLRLVGRGGMGAVYEAERADDAYRQRVAIKTLWRGADSDVLLRRFRSERQILAALQHPNIAQLVDGGTTAEGTPWLAMEYVDGTPIDAWCDARRLGLAARLDLFRQVCAAVHHAHQRLVVHRDLKPANILVGADGTVKLLDFGVARLTEGVDEAGTLTSAGYSPFTASYAAPEQAAGAPVSTAADVYALGAVLCVLLAGAPPHALEGSDPIRRLLIVRDAEPRLPSAIAAAQPPAVAVARGVASAGRLAAALRGELDAIAAMALRRDPARRYASAEALSDDVRRWLRRDRVLARPDTAGYRLWSFARRHRALVASLVTAFASVAVAGVVALRQASAIRAEAARAERAAAFLSGIVSGVNATSAEPLVRMPPSGTLAQLLDSALLRVPREFGEDARMRARLYTAIGANIASQWRLAEARRVLDSARLLARQGYGATSEPFARASLEYATVALALDGPRAADAPLADIEPVVRRAPRDADLAARTRIVRAARALPMGRVLEADSLAAVVLDDEARQGRRTPLSVTAEGLRMAASGWIRRDPRDYLRRARAVQALADSLGLSLTSDQLTAAWAEIEALLVLGRAEEALGAVARWEAALRTVTTAAGAADASLRHTRAFLAAVQGDTARRRTLVAEAYDRMRASPDVTHGARLLIADAFIDDALARGDAETARRAADASLDRLRPTDAPMVLSFATLYAGRARLAAGDPAGAAAALREGLALVARTPDLVSMGPRLRRVLAEALAAEGRAAAADSVRALDPPRGSVPRCTPGGEWRGCPDR